MSHGTWAHRAIMPAVRVLAKTPATPNQVTTARLLTGLAAAAAFAVGTEGWTSAGGVLCLISMLLDRADGQLARLTGRTSAWAHDYDLIADNIATTALFIGIGLGLRDGALGLWAPVLGVLAGASITTIFWVVERIEALTPPGRDAIPGAAGFDPDDLLFVVAPLAWLGWLSPFLIVAAIGAPLFLIPTAIYWRKLRRRD